MLNKTVKIINKLGLHARAAAKFVKCTSGHVSMIQVSKGTQHVNGKSIMGVMMLAASQGTELDLTIEGEDEKQLASAIEELLETRFGEDE